MEKCVNERTGSQKEVAWLILNDVQLSEVLRQEGLIMSPDR